MNEPLTLDEAGDTDPGADTADCTDCEVDEGSAEVAVAFKSAFWRITKLGKAKDGLAPNKRSKASTASVIILTTGEAGRWVGKAANDLIMSFSTYSQGSGSPQKGCEEGTHSIWV